MHHLNIKRIVKSEFYLKLEDLLDYFPKCIIQTVLQDFKTKIGNGGTPVIEQESLQVSNETRIRFVNSVTTKDLNSKINMYYVLRINILSYKHT